MLEVEKSSPNETILVVPLLITLLVGFVGSYCVYCMSDFMQQKSKTIWCVIKSYLNNILNIIIGYYIDNYYNFSDTEINYSLFDLYIYDWKVIFKIKDKIK